MALHRRHEMHYLRFATIALVITIATMASATPRCHAVEIGVDASLNKNVSGDTSAFGFWAPAVNSLQSPATQFVRIGVQTSRAGQVEFSPGIALSSARLATTRTTTTKVGLGVCYLLGRMDGKRSPFVRLGGQYRAQYHAGLDSMVLAAGPAGAPMRSLSQLGLTGGGGLRWRLGRVIGARVEAGGVRWFAGDLPARSEVFVRGGVSAFSK